MYQFLYYFKLIEVVIVLLSNDYDGNAGLVMTSESGLKLTPNINEEIL